jgi:pimeloyl-ACP methyl ester carboxylesterase
MRASGVADKTMVAQLGKPISLVARKFLPIITLLGLAGCATPVPNDPELAYIDRSRLPPANLALQVPGLSPCTTSKDSTLHLNSQEPVTVMVHGCFGSAARFRALSEVFAFHGQQSVCFSYNDRDSLTTSADELVTSLQQLSASMDNPHITVIGHSQGGLIARNALTRERARPWATSKEEIRLVTISSPFAGIQAAEHCGSPTIRKWSLGLVVPACMLISGGKWFDITYASDFIRKPGTLIDGVNDYLKVVTDERGTCRQYNENDLCAEDDLVFNLEEQYQSHIDNHPVTTNIEIAAGHAEIVGDHRVQPRKLITLLQQQGVMKQTAASERRSFEQLLLSLY